MTPTTAGIYSQQLEPRTAGSVFNSCEFTCTPPYTFPTDGWAVRFYDGTQYRYTDVWDSSCPWAQVDFPDVAALHAAPHSQCGGSGGRARVATLLEEQLINQEPVRDYDGTTVPDRTVPAPPDPGQAAIRQQVQEELEQRPHEYQLLDPWLAHQLDPQTYDDPIDDEEHVDDCDPADSLRGGDPGASRGTGDYITNPTEWRNRYDIVPSSAYPQGSAVPKAGLPGSGGRAYMRWGFTKPNEKPAIRFQGWGYRKIRAKHGWGPTALDLTKKALLNPPQPLRFSGDQYREHLSLEADRYPNRRGGRLCEWVVVVQRDPYEEPKRPEQSQRMPMGGIITAYGRYPRPG